MRRIDAIASRWLRPCARAIEAKNYVFSVSVFTTAGMSAMVLGASVALELSADVSR